MPKINYLAVVVATVAWFVVFVVVQPSLVRQGVDGAERHKPRRHGRGETAGSEDNRRVCSGLCRRLRASALCRASWRRRLEGCAAAWSLGVD